MKEKPRNILEKKLEELRDRWRGKIPKSNSKNYFKFRCDKSYAIQLKCRIERIDSGNEEAPEGYWLDAKLL